jgi:hypothetical protein
MKIGALTAAGFSLLLASAFGMSAHAQAAPHVIASWAQSYKELDLRYESRLTSTGTAVVFEDHMGRYGKPLTKATRDTLAFADIGCVTARGDEITLYPVKRWAVVAKNLKTGKVSRGSSILLTFPDKVQAKNALRGLERESPRVAQKLGACKSDVDLYGLTFGTLSSGDDPFSWQEDSIMGTSDYNVWTSDGVLFAEVNTPKLMHAYYKLPLSRIDCVKMQPSSRGLAAVLYVYPALPDDVLARDVGPGKPATYTTSDINLPFNTNDDAQSALQYLQGRSGVFSARLDKCAWPGEL